MPYWGRMPGFGQRSPSQTGGSVIALPDGEELVGPFANWVNVVTSYGADPSGATDSTTAIQNALTALAAGGSPNLYFPGGTYKVSSQLSLVGNGGLSITGAAPSTTKLLWTGSAGSSLLLVDGTGYAKYSLLTFDAAQGPGYNQVMLNLSTTAGGGTRIYNTGSQISDCVFQNTGKGIIAATGTAGTSETTVLRCIFNNVNYGTVLYNPNALDWWHWYCQYNGTAQAGTGISNYDGSFGNGAYSAYYCGFNNLNVSVYLANTGLFNFRGNYSYNGSYHIYEQFAFTNAAPSRSQSETIQAYSGNGGQSVFQGNMGPLSMTDMIIQSPSSLSSPPGSAATTPIEIGGSTAGDIIEVGNTFTVTGAIIANPTSGGIRQISWDDSVVSYSSLNYLTPPAAPAPPPNYGRAVFEVTAGSSTATIQAAINSAAALNNGAIVHLQYGTYSLSTGLTCPANAYFQIVGDGFYAPSGTAISWSGTGACLTLNGPSKVTLREFNITSSGSGTAILISGADQIGGRVWSQGVECTGASSAGCIVHSLNNALVEFRDANFQLMTSGTGLQVLGGSSPTAACATHMLSGSGNGNLVTLAISGAPNVVFRDFFFDAGGGVPTARFATISGGGAITIEGCTTYTPTGQDFATCTSFSGKATFLCNQMESNVTIDAASSGNVWVAGCNFDTASTWLTANSGSGTSFFNLCRQVGGGGSVPITDPGGLPSQSFVETMLAQSRACVPVVLASNGAGVTDVRMYRVSVNAGTVGIHITT